MLAGLAGLAGCTSRGTPAATTPATAAPARTAAPGTSAPAAALPRRPLASPGCSASTDPGPPLAGAGDVAVSTGGEPFGVAVTPDGRWGFVVTSASSGAAVVKVLRLGAARPSVTMAGSVPLPATPAAGAAVTPDGKYLLVAAGDGAVVVSVARAEAGGGQAVLGMLTAPAPGGQPPGSDGAIEVAASPDSRFAFVTLEGADQAAVFDLATAVAQGFGPAGYVGAIPLGLAPVGLAVSPSGSWLYVTSEAADPAQHPVSYGKPGGCDGKVPATQSSALPGTLTVASRTRAETDPAASVTATVDAGHQPVRVITAASGDQVWVTARASDDVLCFSAAGLAADPARALVAITRVGSEPVGLAAVRDGSLLVVADSNRFSAAAATADLSVVSASAALASRPAVAGVLSTGLFPRDMALSPDGTLLVSDYASGQVQAIDTARLPG